MLELKPLEKYGAFESQDIPSVLYSPRMRNLYATIKGPVSGEDISFVIMDDKVPIAYCIAYICQGAKEISVSAPIIPASFWLTVHYTPNIYGEVKKLAERHFKKTIIQYKNIKIQFMDFFSFGTLSPISQYIMQSYNCKTYLMFNHIIDLTITQETLKKNLRPSYKPLINKFSREFTFNILSRNIEQKHIDCLHECHILASGRDVYPKQEFWNAWLEECKLGHGFLIIAYQHARPVGASLYSISDESVYYSIGAYDRDLRNFGLSHGCTWQAILYAKSIGKKIFEMGRTDYKCLEPNINEKDLTIGFFKRGFGGHNRPCLYIESE